MGTRIGRAVIAGAVMWAGLTACSAAVMRDPGGGGSAGMDLGGPAGPRSPAGAPFAIVWQRPGPHASEYLARIDPRTLEPRRRFELGRRAARVTSFSPDASRLLMVTLNGHARVADVTDLTQTARYDLDVKAVRDVAWVEEDVAIVTVPRGRTTRFVRFDPRDGTVLGSEEVEGSAFAWEPVAGGLVTLLHGWSEDADPVPTTIAAMGADGAIDSASLDRIGAGYYQVAGSDYSTLLQPALAVRGSQATVVGTGGEVATVDLDGLDVRWEDEPASLFDTVAGWFTPAAHAKSVEGTSLEAEWIGADALLVSGYRTELAGESEYSATSRTEPAGAVVLRPSDGSLRTLDEDATSAAPAGDVVLATHSYVPGDEAGDGMGIRAYGGGRRMVWERLGTEVAEVVVVTKRSVVVRHGLGPVRMSALDLRTGRVLATRRLLASFAPGHDEPF